MGAVQRRFQVCEDEMDNWQILLGDLRIAPLVPSGMWLELLSA
jgi:hypothetical protein